MADKEPLFHREQLEKISKILLSLNCKMSRQIVAVLTVWSISETWKRKMAFGDHNQAINETASIQESSLNRKKFSQPNNIHQLHKYTRKLN